MNFCPDCGKRNLTDHRTGMFEHDCPGPNNPPLRLCVRCGMESDGATQEPKATDS